MTEPAAKVHAAEVRARDTLRMFLNAEQRETYDSGGWFEIPREYGIYRLGPAITTTFYAPGHIRTALMNSYAMPLCVHPRTLHKSDDDWLGNPYAHIPTADHLLAKKLMIDYNEDMFWNSVAPCYSLEWARRHWEETARILQEREVLRRQMNARLKEEAEDRARIEQARMTCAIYGVETTRPFDTIRRAILDRIFRYPCDS